MVAEECRTRIALNGCARPAAPRGCIAAPQPGCTTMGFLSFLLGRRPTPVHALAGNGGYRIEVVGESHYQEVLEAICGGRTEAGADHDCVATLVPEPDNPHDRNAIRVDIGGRTVGYLPRADAIGYRDGLALAGIPMGTLNCRAVVRGGWDRGGTRGYFGVMLDMDWPPRARSTISRSR